MIDNLEISKKKTIMSVLLSVVMVGLIVVCPNVISFEPYGIPEADADGSFDVDDENMYYLKDERGMYKLYIDGKYAMTSDIILDENIPIYLEVKEKK